MISSEPSPEIMSYLATEVGIGISNMLYGAVEAVTDNEKLLAATLMGDLEAVKILLETGANVNDEILRTASKAGSSKIFNLLLDAKLASPFRSSNSIPRTSVKYGKSYLPPSLAWFTPTVEDAARRVASSNGLYTNVLQYFSHTGDEHVVRGLIKIGADVNARGGTCGTALSAASGEGHLEIVRLLLVAGADVEAHMFVSSNALCAASRGGHVEVVQSLLDAGADVNAYDFLDGNALCAASRQGHLEVVRLLLDVGADMDAAGGLSGNALCAASRAGHPEVVQLLLSTGADIDAKHGVFGTALQIASADGNTETVTLLLKSGADINAQCGMYGFALQATCLKAFELIMKLLLDGEADVDTQGGPFRGFSRASRTGQHWLMINLLSKYREAHDVIEDYVREFREFESRICCFTIDLEIERFIEEQLGGNRDLSDTLVVTGDLSAAYATTCRSYVQDTWGRVGTDILKFASSLGLSEWSHHPLIRAETVRSSPIQFTSRDMTSVKRYMCSITTSNVDEMIAVIQTLAWIAATFRLPNPGRPQCSKLRFLTVWDTLSIRFDDSEVIQPGDTSFSCWHKLLPNTNVVSGFPIRTNEVAGLYMAFDLMLDIADIIQRTDLSDLSGQPDESNKYGHGVFFNGVESILYPVEAMTIQGSRIILWHFDNSGETTLPPTDWLRVSNDDDFATAVHVLGFTANSQVHLGTRYRQQDYERMEQSSASDERNRIELELDSVSLTIGRAPIQTSFGGKIKYTRGQRVIVDSEQRRYEHILNVTERQASILYDHGPERVGWLVSQISVILDLIHYEAYKKQWRIPEFAATEANGGAAAAKILRKAEVANWTLYVYDGSDVRVKDLVKEIYIAMFKRRVADEVSSCSTSRFRHDKLRGWDLLELLEPPDYSYRREVSIHETTSRVIPEYPSWLPLTKRVPVYFGDNLGEIITSSTEVCCSKVWRGKKLLVASVHILKHLSRKKIDCKDFHLEGDLVWECRTTRPAVSPFCKRHHQGHTDEAARQIFDNSIQSLKTGKHQCGTSIEDLSSICEDGAVVFGPKTTWISEFNDFADRIMPAVEHLPAANLPV